MTLKIITPDVSAYPARLQPLLSGAALYDSSGSPEASVIFIHKDGGCFLKSAPKDALAREAAMPRYFHSKGLAASVLAYISEEQDWLLTERILGDGCTAVKYLDQPEKLCDTLAQQLAIIHAMDFDGCPILNHTERYLAKAEYNKMNGVFDKNLFADKCGWETAEEAWRVIESGSRLLQTDTLLHGDYCLPNIILDDWNFSGFIDLDNSGVGDRHVDLFWATWTLNFNLKTDKYRERFIDAYGRENVYEERLRVVAAIEAFG
jgi:kanamycin kinase